MLAKAGGSARAKRVNALGAVARQASARQPSILVGLVGRGIQSSRSPRMHEAEGARLGLAYVYRLIDTAALPGTSARLADLIRSARLMGFSGLNITHPYKEEVLSCLDRLSPEAAAIGAVNTVVFEAGGSAGYNTDCWGFAESFRRGMSEARKERVVLLGAGGAGLAVARALFDLGVGRLAVFDTNPDKAAALIARLADPRAERTEDAQSAIGSADGLVNATPVGMKGYPGCPVPAAWLRTDLWVADIVYFPAETELLRAARRQGCRTLSGAGMAIFQAVRAFELFSGVTPDPEAMARHFRAADEAPPD